MQVFISWSGDSSRAIADVLTSWIRDVIQEARPFYSPDHVKKGSRWAAEISGRLQACEVGILVLTGDNYKSPWVLFEAGALSKHIEKARVCSLLFGGLTPGHLAGSPLSQFQNAEFNKDEMLKVVAMVNDAAGDNALPDPHLERAFERWWPDLETRVRESLEKAPAKQLDPPDPTALLTEILNAVNASRVIERQGGVPAAMQTEVREEPTESFVVINGLGTFRRTGASTRHDVEFELRFRGNGQSGRILLAPLPESVVEGVRSGQTSGTLTTPNDERYRVKYLVPVGKNRLAGSFVRDPRRD